MVMRNQNDDSDTGAARNQCEFSKFVWLVVSVKTLVEGTNYKWFSNTGDYRQQLQHIDDSTDENQFKVLHK